MNTTQRDQWIDGVLVEVMKALMGDDKLRAALVFKGAWILNFHLGENRHSMDIDAAAEPMWAKAMENLDAEEAYLGKYLPQAVTRHFEKQSPVRFALEKIKITRNPPQHPRNWDMIQVSLTIKDSLNPTVRGLPAVELEVSAPESYGTEAVETREFLGVPAQVYALHRIAGEKLRAYLTSLPEYRRKMEGSVGRERAVRVKDLFDIARILKARPISYEEFWTRAAAEFRLACASRYVDCESATTFKQAWEQVRARYNEDRHLAAVPFAEVEEALDQVLAFFSQSAFFPLRFTLPPL